MADKKPEKATASNQTVKSQLATVLLENKQLREERDTALDQLKEVKRQLTEANTVLENDLKAEYILKVVALSTYKQSDLEPLKIEELQRIYETLLQSKTAASKPTFQTIKAGAATVHRGTTTVGSLFGKTRKEILEMGGEF